MPAFVSIRQTWSPAHAALMLARIPLILLPAALLFAAAQRTPGSANLILWFGAAFQVVIAGVILLTGQLWRQMIGPLVITLYLTALSWLWFGDGIEDWLNHFAKAVLVVVPILTFGYQNLLESGALMLRRANTLAQRLATRQEWPADLSQVRNLPEVKALRAALVYDAGPALILLRHPRPEVRLAALAALEFRKDWRPGQPELVLQQAQAAEQPAIRAAAVAALANVEDRELIEMVATFLHDNSLEVRRAAVEAVLWDCEKRWPSVRYAVRRVLADPLFSGDGPMVPDGQLLSAEAVKDLTGWCAEKGIVSARAAQTLAAHYNRLLSERPDVSTVAALRVLLADSHTAAVLRLELGRLLQLHQELDVPLLEKLADPLNPGSLRLIACETILSEHGDKPILRTLAVSALKDLARLSNRELAISTADVVQRRLGIDLGLGLDQPLPPLHSRQASEVTRRVMRWANQFDESEDLEKSGIRR